MITKKKLCVLAASAAMTVGAYASVAGALAQCIPNGNATFLFSTTPKTKQCAVVVNGTPRSSTASFQQFLPITYQYSVSYEAGIPAGGQGQAFPCDTNGKGLKDTAGSSCPIAGDNTKNNGPGLAKNCTTAAAQVFIGISST